MYNQLVIKLAIVLFVAELSWMNSSYANQCLELFRAPQSRPVAQVQAVSVEPTSLTQILSIRIERAKAAGAKESEVRKLESAALSIRLLESFILRVEEQELGSSGRITDSQRLAKTIVKEFKQQLTTINDSLFETTKLIEELKKLKALDKDIQEWISERDQTIEFAIDLGRQIFNRVRELRAVKGDQVILEVRRGKEGFRFDKGIEDVLKMYSKFASSKGWTVDILELDQDSAAPDSFMIQVIGKDVFNLLQGENGTHLFRKNKDGNPHVENIIVEAYRPFEMNQADMENLAESIDMKFIRASGKGGQNVNKVSTGVFARYKPDPTIFVKVDTERSQAQNREIAIKLIRAKVEAKKLREAEEKALAARQADQQKLVDSNSRHVRRLDFAGDASLEKKIMNGEIGDILQSQLEARHIELLRRMIADVENGSFLSSSRRN